MAGGQKSQLQETNLVTNPGQDQPAHANSQGKGRRCKAPSDPRQPNIWADHTVQPTVAQPTVAQPTVAQPTAVLPPYPSAAQQQPAYQQAQPQQAQPQYAPVATAASATQPATQHRVDGAGLSTISLVLGIVSISMGIFFILPLAGLIVGLMAKKRPDHDVTQTKWAIIINAIMLGVSVLMTLFIIMIFALVLTFAFSFAAMAASTGYGPY